MTAESPNPLEPLAQLFRHGPGEFDVRACVMH
jgi:hypothetical protein